MATIETLGQRSILKNAICHPAKRFPQLAVLNPFLYGDWHGTINFATHNHQFYNQHFSNLMVGLKLLILNWCEQGLQGRPPRPPAPYMYVLECFYYVLVLMYAESTWLAERCRSLVSTTHTKFWCCYPAFERLPCLLWCCWRCRARCSQHGAGWKA